jgi:hypothetical protein
MPQRVYAERPGENPRQGRGLIAPKIADEELDTHLRQDEMQCRREKKDGCGENSDSLPRPDT